MSAEETNIPHRLEPAGQARGLVDAWVESLAQVFESMADERLEFRREPASESAIPEGDGVERELLLWEQPFEGAADAKAWVGAPRSAWEYTGGRTLRAAGLEPKSGSFLREGVQCAASTMACKPSVFNQNGELRGGSI